MNNEDKKTLELIKDLIREVKTEVYKKKVLSEAKTPEQIFENHEKKMREYIEENVYKAIQNSK